MTKPKVGVFGLTGCGGCQLEVLNLEEYLLDFLNAVDIVNFTEAISELYDTYEIALIEGSVTTNHDIERLEHIAKIAKVIIAVGACACIGGINCLKNLYGTQKAKELVYIVTSLILGKIPEIPGYPVCVECKRLGNTCLYEFGMECKGPISRAGC